MRRLAKASIAITKMNQLPAITLRPGGSLVRGITPATWRARHLLKADTLSAAIKMPKASHLVCVVGSATSHGTPSSERTLRNSSGKDAGNADFRAGTKIGRLELSLRHKTQRLVPTFNGFAYRSPRRLEGTALSGVLRSMPNRRTSNSHVCQASGSVRSCSMPFASHHVWATSR